MNTERDLGEVEQNQHRNHPSSANQPCLEELDPQEIEIEDASVEDDPELADIATRLRETASYAINPTFREELRKELLQQFIEHRTRNPN